MPDTMESLLREHLAAQKAIQDEARAHTQRIAELNGRIIFTMCGGKLPEEVREAVRAELVTEKKAV